VRIAGLRQFEINFTDADDEIEIDLALPPANDGSAPATAPVLRLRPAGGGS
jgi:hypothetical protein